MRDEKEIISLIVDEGQIDLFELLIEKYKVQVFAIAGKRVPDNDRNMVAQEIFVRAFNSLPAFSRDCPFGNWLSRIAQRACCDYWRKNYRRIKNESSPPLTEEHNQWLEDVSREATLNVHAVRESRQTAIEIINWLLTHLKTEDRMLIEMIYLEGIPLMEAAATLGWGISKTKVRAMRARQKMHDIIKAREDD